MSPPNPKRNSVTGVYKHKLDFVQTTKEAYGYNLDMVDRSDSGYESGFLDDSRAKSAGKLARESKEKR